MATLTPGVLLKLLQAMNTDAKVAGEYRSAVLQVIGIVPALSGGGAAADELWPSHGFYIQLSDSLNSTYVSLSDRDADAVLCNRPQLGQLVHVDRLHFSHPVPRASGLRPVPSARHPQPFAGSPEPLVARISPSRDGFVIQPASPSRSGPPLISNHSHLSESGVTRVIFQAKENVSNVTNATNAPSKRRFSSPAGAKLASRKSASEHRDPSPANRLAYRASSPALSKSGSRSSSPVPSKCVVPGLVAAKEENRRAAREPAIIVPSRYRQPSPVGGRRGAASPVTRRSSGSPGRRLSGGMKVSPAAGEGSKKRSGLVIAGISRVSEALGGSGRSVRKSWEDRSPGSSKSLEMKEKGASKSKVDPQAILRTQVALSQRLSDAGREQFNNGDTSTNEKQNHVCKIESNLSGKPTITSQNKNVHDRKWTDGSIPLDTVSDNLARLGKDALQRRNIASIAAAEALEEALAIESIVRSLSMFSDLCSSPKAGNPLPTTDHFLSIYDDVMKWNAAIESLALSRVTNRTPDAASIERSKSLSLWVEAALATDLQVLSLLNNTTESSTKQRISEKPLVSSVEPPRLSLSKKNSLVTPAKHLTKVPSSSTTDTWTRGYEIGETVILAKTLRREMQTWFLKFVEEAFDVGFRLFGEYSENGRETSHRDNSKIAAVLSHLKRVNEWLDGVGRKPEEETLVMKIERVKRKIYGFVISHVGSAFDGSLPISKA